MQKIAAVVVAASALIAGGCAERSFSLIAPVVPAGKTSCSSEAPLGRQAKVANYNIKSGLWTSLAEVGDTLEKMDADVVALEEVDNGTGRSGHIDESAALAERLHMQRVFAAALERDGGTYGVALLSRFPIVNAERFDLPDVGNFEPRVAIDATVCVGDAATRFVGAHADVFPWAAKEHARAIAERVADSTDVVVLGDFNTTPDSGDTKPFLDAGYADALAKFDDRPTFGDKKSGNRIDYILTDRNITGANVIDSDASDHRPVTANLDVGNVGNADAE